MSWLARSHPELVDDYRRLYRRGAYLPPEYRQMLRERVAPMVSRYGLGGGMQRIALPDGGQRSAVVAQPTLF